MLKRSLSVALAISAVFMLVGCGNPKPVRTTQPPRFTHATTAPSTAPTQGPTPKSLKVSLKPKAG